MAESADGNGSSRRLVLRTVLVTLLVVVLVAGAFIAYAVNYPPSFIINPVLTSAVEAKTGRSFTISGDTALAMSETPRLTLDKVALAGGSEGATPAFQAERVEADIKVQSWINQQFEILSVTITRPVLSIVPGDPLLVKLGEGKIGGTVPGAVEIVDGTFIVPGQNGPVSLEKINARISQAEGAAMKIVGDMVALGETVRFDGTLDDVFGLGGGGKSPLKLKLMADKLEAALDGKVATAPIGQFTGKVTAATTKLSELLKWTGFETAGTDLGEVASFDGEIVGSTRRLRFDPAKVKIEGFEGDLIGELSMEGMRPALTASLTTPKLDINGLLPGATGKATLGLESLDDVVLMPSPWESLLEELEGTRDEANARKVAVEAAGGWSSDPFTIKDLPAIDMDLAVKAGEIVYGKLPLTDSELMLTTRAKRLEVVVSKMKLKDGDVEGRVDIDTSKGPLATTVRMKFDRVEFDPVLAEFVGRRSLEGSGSGSVNVTGIGASMRELIGSLNGSAAVALEKGAIIGIDLRRAIFSLGAAQKYDPARRTRFNSVKASVDIKDGTVRSTDQVRLSGPEVDIATGGTFGLVSRRLDQKIDLKLYPPPLALPLVFRMRGTLDKPEIGWDVLSSVTQPHRFSSLFDLAPKEERMPDDVRARIESVLAAKDGAELSPEVRAFLEKLLQTR